MTWVDLQQNIFKKSFFISVVVELLNASHQAWYKLILK